MNKEHKMTMSLLPWHVNETLTGKESDLVLKHLGECGDCRLERDRLCALHQLVNEVDNCGVEADLSYRRVMNRIDVAERNRESVENIEAVLNFSSVSTRGPLRESLPKTWRRAAIGVAATVMLMMGSVVLYSPDNQGEFQTLSSNITIEGGVQQVEIGFVNPIPAATMRQALVETRSNIVSGPDTAGGYLVEVVVPHDVSANDYLSRIRQIDGVKYARFPAN